MEKSYCDITYLQNFSGGDNERVKKYINIFLASAPISIQKLNTFYSTSDWNGVRSVAHSIKPQITFMGIKNLDKIIRDLEEYSQTNTNLDKIPGLINEFNYISNKAMDELKQTILQL
jgi:HPt (histidine-containing phosphotransfer) domain-containing protein